MFDLAWDEDLELIAETARSFAAEELRPQQRVAEAERAPAPEVRRAFAAMGLARLEWPESLGGAGLGSVARCVVNEELAAGDPGAALALDPLGPALYPLAELGGDAALRELALPVLDRAEAGARAVLVTSRDARLQIGADTVTGRIPWVPADRVDLLVLLLAEGALVIREGIATASVRGAGLRAAGASEIRLEGAPIAARLPGSQGASRALDRARLAAAALLLGVMREACAFSRRYALERRAFGRPIAHHQALAFLIADMQMAVDGARLLVQEAAWRLDARVPVEGAAAAAYAEAIVASRLVGPNAVQILGGHGFMQDYPVEKSMREGRALGLLWGGLDAAQEDAGRVLVAASGPVSLSHGEAG
jgi:alkylation response protein AidB-like acyl-CoA dehydrogenase